MTFGHGIMAAVGPLAACGEEAATIKPNPIESMTDNDAKAEQRDVESRGAAHITSTQMPTIMARKSSQS